MDEEFYGSIKLVSGEEIFAEILPVEENGRNILVCSDPVEIETVSINGAAEGLRMMPWLRSIPKEGLVVIPMDKAITVVEAAEDSEVVTYYTKFVMANFTDGSERIKVTKKMGYLNSVEKAREQLEKLYKNKPDKAGS